MDPHGTILTWSMSVRKKVVSARDVNGNSLELTPIRQVVP